MSDQAVAVIDTNPTPVSLPYKGPDDLSARLLEKYSDFVRDYNEQRARLLAAEGDKDRAVQEFIQHSDHKDAVRLRKAIETATSKLRELAESNTVTEELPEEEKEKLKTELGLLGDKIKGSSNAINSIIDNMSPDPEGVKAALVAIGNPTLSNRGRRAGGTGSSLPRARATLTITGGNLENKLVESFSKAAILFNCEVKDLQLAYAQAAGVKHEDIKTINKEVTFEFQPNENGSVYIITATPKHTNKPGPKKAGEVTEAEAEEDGSD